MQDVRVVVQIQAGDDSVRMDEVRYADFGLLAAAILRVATGSTEFAQMVLDLPYANSRGLS